HVADRAPSEREPVARIALNCLLEKTERLRNVRRRRENDRISAKVEVVRGGLARWYSSRTVYLSGLQRRFDNPGHARRDLVLKIEDVLQRAVEAVRPQMGAARRVDQLAGDTHPVTGSAHRAFEYIADA